MFCRCELLRDEKRQKQRLLTNNSHILSALLYVCVSFISAWHTAMLPVPLLYLTISKNLHSPDLQCVKPILHNLCFKKRYSSFIILHSIFFLPRLNMHCLRNDTYSKYFFAKAELYNFPISLEHLCVERRNYMAMNGFLNSDITS